MVSVTFHDDGILILQFFLVEHVFAEARTDAAQVGDVVRVLLDGLDLLVEELLFQVVRQMRITTGEREDS